MAIASLDLIYVAIGSPLPEVEEILDCGLPERSRHVFGIEQIPKK